MLAAPTVAAGSNMAQWRRSVGLPGSRQVRFDVLYRTTNGTIVPVAEGLAGFAQIAEQVLWLPE